MKALRSVQLMLLIGVLAMSAGTASGQQAKADPTVQMVFDTLLEAIKNGDRDTFVAHATDAVKDAFTPKVMEALGKQIGARLKKGFTPIYLCSLKQAGYQVYLWKVSFTDDGDDLIVRVALKDGKLAGFFLQ